MNGARTTLLGMLVALSLAASPACGQSKGVSEYFPSATWGGEWVERMSAAWAVELERAPLPERTVDAVLSVLRPEWVPRDPVVAARELHRLVLVAEVQRMRGEPLWSVRARLRHEMEGTGRSLAQLGAALRQVGAGRSPGAARREDSDSGGSGPPGDNGSSGHGRP